MSSHYIIPLPEEPSSFINKNEQQPSNFASRLKTEYDYYQGHLDFSSSSPKPLIDLSQADHVKYPHFTPHNFLATDLSKNLYEFGNEPNMELRTKKQAIDLILEDIKPKQKRLNSSHIILTQSEETAHEVLIRSMCDPGDNVIVGAPGNPK